MKDKIALVTGSTRGIGRDIVLKLGDVTAAVAVHYRNDRQAAEDVVKKIRKKGKSSASFCADLTKAREAAALIRKVEKKFGKIDILVNNFGPILVKSWEKVTPEEWDYVLRSNLLSALYCLKAVLPGTGLLILTRSVAASEASYGITVNMVSPGLVEGGILPESKNIPRGRLGKFEDVSRAVLFLVSEDADFITGTNLVVAGGWKI